MGLVLKALWLDLVDKKLGDCTTVVKDDAQEVTEKVVMTTLVLKKQASQTCQTICKFYSYKLICSDCI